MGHVMFRVVQWERLSACAKTNELFLQEQILQFLSWVDQQIKDRRNRFIQVHWLATWINPNQPGEVERKYKIKNHVSHALPCWDVCFDSRPHLHSDLRDPQPTIFMIVLFQHSSIVTWLRHLDTFAECRKNKTNKINGTLFTSWPRQAQGRKSPSARHHGSQQRRKTWPI